VRVVNSVPTRRPFLQHFQQHRHDRSSSVRAAKADSQGSGVENLPLQDETALPVSASAWA
jgi:hypothetical protein